LASIPLLIRHAVKFFALRFGGYSRTRMRC
jgi:hypothetical protein